LDLDAWKDFSVCWWVVDEHDDSSSEMGVLLGVDLHISFVDWISGMLKTLLLGVLGARGL
jgi:hypothetical protein